MALRARREEAVEAAIERRARHHGDEDGGNRGDDGEQADDLHVQPRAGAAAPARLHDDPDFAADDAEQQQPGHGIAEQQLLDHGVDRRNRGQPGEHQEGGGRREQRYADRDRADQAGGEGIAGMRLSPQPASMWRNLIDRRHGRSEDAGLLSKGGKFEWSPATHPPRVMLLYNNVARLRQFLGDCVQLGRQTLRFRFAAVR